MVARYILIAVVCLAGCTDSQGSPVAPSTPELTTLEDAVRVSVERVDRTTLQQASEVTGIVAAFRKATVAAEVAGRVLKRRVEPGDPVAAGNVLVELDGERARLGAAQSQAAQQAATVRLAQAEQDLARGQRLTKRGAISQDAVDDFAFAVELASADLAAAKATLRTAQRAQRDSRVTAPFAGTAEQVHVQVGDYLNPGMPVATLADFSKARVRAGVTAAEAATVSVGQAALVTIDALGGVPIEGEIKSVAKIGDSVSGTYPVEIWLEGEATDHLREGMVAAIVLTLGTAEPKPTIPRAALTRRNGRAHVFRVIDSVAQLTPISVGRGNRTHVTVSEGLAAGDVVVVEGQFSLRDGATVVVQ